MNQLLTDTEKSKIQNLCFENPAKDCAVAQEIIDTCGVVSCSTYSVLKGGSKRAVQYKSEKLIGLKIEARKFISINQ